MSKHTHPTIEKYPLLPKRLINYRINNKLNQNAVAEKLNITQSAYSSLERGKLSPSDALIEKIANMLSIKVSEINDPIDTTFPTDETVGERMKRTRIYFGKSQPEFAKTLGISQALLSSIELDRTKPSFIVFQNLSKLGCDLDWIATGKPGKSLRTHFDEAVKKHQIEKINQLLNLLSPETLNKILKNLQTEIAKTDISTNICK